MINIRLVNEPKTSLIRSNLEIQQHMVFVDSINILLPLDDNVTFLAIDASRVSEFTPDP